MLAACILSYDMYTFLIVFQLSYQIQMRQFDNWPSKSKLREQVSTLGFDLRELIFGLRRLPNQYIMREINVERGLATSHHVWHVGLWHQTSSSTSTKKSYNKPLNFKMEIPDTIFCLKIKFWIQCCFKTPKVI